MFSLLTSVPKKQVNYDVQCLLLSILQLKLVIRDFFKKIGEHRYCFQTIDFLIESTIIFVVQMFLENYQHAPMFIKVWERQLFSFLLVESKEKGGAFDNYLQFFQLISLKMIISVIHKYYFSNFWIYRWDSLMSLLLNLCRLPANTKTFLRSPQTIILDVFFAAIKNVLTRKVILRVFYLRYKIHDLVKRS